MRFLGRSLIGLFLLAATIGLLAMAGLMVQSAFKARADRDNAAPSGRERVFSANVVMLEPSTITPILSSFGELATRRSLDIRARASGTVVEMSEAFVNGGQVDEGAFLLRIDPTDYKAALSLAETDLTQSEAELRDATAALDLARDDLDNARRQAELRDAALARQNDLVGRGVGTEAAVENAALAAASAAQVVLGKRQAVITAEARVATAEATLSRREIARDEAQRRLDETEIRAAFAGTLTDVTVLRGGLVAPNEKLGRLVDPNKLEVGFRVSTAQYARLLADNGALSDLPVTVRLEATGVDLTATGRVDRESANVGEGQTGRMLFANLDATPGLRPGDFVTVELSEPPLDQVVRLPATALDASGSILLLGDEDRLERAQVTLLRRQGDDVLVRGTGLNGREAITKRSPVLGEGIRVRPVRDGKLAPEAKPEMVALDPARIALLKSFVESNTRMPESARDRILRQLDEGELPADTLARLEKNMGN
ncbi:HlyD family efflux transporter periplasmic adaptor subunit [Aliiroseovarius sp. S1123]|uniref:efflux RND transporter periplasmic adaptor subunit n=1 Tax=Aliiroseovarius sp. S1123 TaxID=2926404 RepID=UPI001FF63684|nr:HlyD family efflux transporter periplasmic adaptor subunit [Aliiroseovarius sp. S1123]MCK0171226.1 HlyD family efflux transporter periplasmic adaptor subunit [Aliiroseovarius sp. S1123]